MPSLTQVNRGPCCVAAARQGLRPGRVAGFRARAWPASM